MTVLQFPYPDVVVAHAIVDLGDRIHQISADLLPDFKPSANQTVCRHPGIFPEVLGKDILSRLQRWLADRLETNIK